jgi:heparanase 1
MTFLFSSVILFIFCVYISTGQLDVSIDTSKEVFRIPRHFVSFAEGLDTPLLNHEKFELVMLNSEKFAMLVRGLSPSYWRYGGREAQSVAFHYSQSDCPAELGKRNRNTPLCLTAKVFDEMYSLTMKTNSMLMLDLNNRVRLEDGSWNSTNVRTLMDYVKAMKYNVTWELGNEPASYQRHFNITVEPEQLVEDYKTLWKIVGANQTVVGPELGSPYYAKYGQSVPPTISNSRSEYFQRWVDFGGEQLVNATSWHFYYLHISNLTLHDMYRPEILDILVQAITTVEQISNTSHLSYWLTETGSSIGSDAVTAFSDSYAAGFMLLYKLGIAAIKNHSVVCQRNLIIIQRGPVDWTLSPLPTYWISYVFKHLVGHGVLSVNGQLEPNKTVHAFAFCTHVSDQAVNKSYSPGAVTVILINLQQTESALINISLPLISNDINVDVYHLTPKDGILISDLIYLNGKQLELGVHNDLPVLTAVQLSGPKYIEVPPLTYGFYVITNANAKACLAES